MNRLTFIIVLLLVASFLLLTSDAFPVVRERAGFGKIFSLIKTGAKYGKRGAKYGLKGIGKGFSALRGVNEVVKEIAEAKENFKMFKSGRLGVEDDEDEVKDVKMPKTEEDVKELLMKLVKEGKQDGGGGKTQPQAAEDKPIEESWFARHWLSIVLGTLLLNVMLFLIVYRIRGEVVRERYHSRMVASASSESGHGEHRRRKNRKRHRKSKSPGTSTSASPDGPTTRRRKTSGRRRGGTHSAK